MATRRLKFKPKPVVGLAVRRAKDGADTSVDPSNGVSENIIEESQGSTPDVHDTPSSTPSNSNEIKENSLTTGEATVVCSSSDNFLNVNSVVSYDQNKESTPNNNDLVLPVLKTSSQDVNRSVLSNEISTNDSTQHINISCDLNGLVVSNGTAKNIEGVSNQTGVSESHNKDNIINIDKIAILERSSHNSETQNSESNKNSDVIITKNVSPRNSSDYSSLNTSTDSNNSMSHLSGESLEQQSGIVKKCDLSLLNNKKMKIFNVVASVSDEGIVVNGDSVTSLNDLTVENNDLTSPPSDKGVENRDDSAVKPSRSETKFKALSRFTRPRCKPVVASNIARRKPEEANRVSTACNDNSNNDQEIKNKPQPSQKSNLVSVTDNVSETSVVHGDLVTESEAQTKQNTCQSEEDNAKTAYIPESIQSHKTDDLANDQTSNDGLSEKMQGADINNENVNDSSENQSSPDDPLNFATVADVNSTTETDNNTSVLDDSIQVTVTRTATTDSGPFKTFSKAKRHHRTHGATYSKMSHDTIENLKKKFGAELPDKTQLKMKDLIFYNPKTNPMLKTIPKKKPSASMKPDTESVVEEILEEQRVDDVEQEEQEQEASPAVPVPQLKIGPDGQVILDPKSLIIETTEMQRSRQNLENSEIILETDGKYGCYSKKRNTRHEWRPEETLQFYRALHTIGTDFSLMATLFPKRSRRDLKLKFKYEEKVNLGLIDKAITNPREFDFKQLEDDIKKENEERARIAAEELRAKEELKKQKELQKQQREEMQKTHRKSVALKEFNVEDTGEFRSLEMKKKKIKKSKNKRKCVDEPAAEEFEQEIIFDYSRIDKMCNVKDQEEKKTKKKNVEKKKNTAKKLCTNKKTVKLSKNNEKKEDESNDDDDRDDVDIFGSILTTTRSGRKPKRSRKRLLEEALYGTKKYAKTGPIQNLHVKLMDSIDRVVNKHVSSVKRNEVITSNAVVRSNEIDEHNNESNVSSLSADLEESFMDQVNGYNSEELTASVTRLTGRLEKRMCHLNNLEKQTPPPPPATANSLSSPLPSFSTLTPGIHNHRALSESMKIIDQLTSDVETACVEMSEDQLIEIIDEADLNHIENENIPVENTTVAALNTDTNGFDKTNSIINVRNSGEHTDNKGNITIITLEFTQSNDDSNNNNHNNTNTEDSNKGGDVDIDNDSVSLIVPHYEVITGDMLGDEVTYFSSNAGTSLVISEQCGSGEEETFLILEEATVEEEEEQQQQQQDTDGQQASQEQQHKNTVTVEDITRAEDSECILGK